MLTDSKQCPFNPSVLSPGAVSTNGFTITLPTNANENITCGAEFPAYKTHHKIAIIGEVPSKDDLHQGKPLTGAAGEMLFNSLRRYGINRADCYVSNVSTESLPEKLKHPLQHPAVIAGISALTNDIPRCDPNAILLVGNLALDAAFPGEKRKASEWRGSILQGKDGTPFAGRKLVVTVSPYNVFKDWSLAPLFWRDLERFSHETSTPTLDLPQRNFELDVSPDRAIALLRTITNVSIPIAMDIEGGVAGVSCISFADSPANAFIVPLAIYRDGEKKHVLKAVADFLASPTPKILQNQLYDNFVLSWSYKMPIQNVIWDTMLSGWEIYPELKKGLGTQVSIWTREPYYKLDGKLLRSKRLHEDKASDDEDYILPDSVTTTSRTLHTYCCKDSACTYELYNAHKSYLQGHPDSFKHFNFNLSLLPALLYMEQRGIGYNKSSATCELTTVSGEMLRLQQLIDNTIENRWKQYGSRGDKPTSVNLNSPKQLADILYVRLGYPKQHPKKGREYDKTKVTTNVDALLALRTKYNGPADEILEHILQWRKQDGLRESLELRTDKDNRIRCSYNIVGTETGRLTCSKSPTKSGANLTTITKSLRHLYIADPDHWFFQCDLSGADGWTVAAHCALRGDPTMLDDYLFGLKPAKITALMIERGDSINKLSREEIKHLCKDVTEDGPKGWLYFACKRVQHGTNYGLGKDQMSLQILKDSYKLLGRTYVITPAECVRLQDMYLRRYPGVKMWQRSVHDKLDTTSKMDCASGHTRKFFGRKGNHSTYMEGYAHEPQANTTYATNYALWRLWTDHKNRVISPTTINGARPQSGPVEVSRNRPLSQFKVEPLHHVHDALCGQFRKSDTDWAIQRIRGYFANPLVIAGRTITIPFEGAYGPSWGQLGEKYGGGSI